MQGISAKEHEKMLANYQRFEELTRAVNSTVLAEDIKTRGNIVKLRETYNRFCSLLSELEQCTKEYGKQKKAVQSIMYKRIRTMNSELRKKS